MMEVININVNPLKPKIVKKQIISAEESGEPAVAVSEPQVEETAEPMSYMDAAKVAIVLSIAFYFVYNFGLANYQDFASDPMQFVFNSAQILGSSFFTNFLSLSGLSRLIARREKE